MCARSGWGDERGAGTALALAILAATVVLALATTTFGAALAARQRVVAAADSAALAAADTLVGIRPGYPCANAAKVASANRVGLGDCRLDGLVVTVSVSATVAGFPVSAWSTAGPSP